VFTGGQTHQNHRLSAGVSPVPRRVIHHDVDVADARCDFQRVGPNTGSMRRFSARY
jgi:hypothetical protein